MGMTGSQEPGRLPAILPETFAGRRTTEEWVQLLKKIAALGVLAGVLLSGCGSPPAPKAQISPDLIARGDIARQAPAPIQISPRAAALYGAYLDDLSGDVSGVLAISPNGNRLEVRFCKHPDCLLTDDEIAERALSRCNRGLPQQDPSKSCVVFDRNGKVMQPYRTWSDSDFNTPVAAPPVLSLKDPAEIIGRFSVMTPEGQLVISLRPPADGESRGRAYFWDTSDNFHQGTWSIKADGVCVDSVDGRSAVTCGKLYGTDRSNIVGASLDLYPGKYLPITRLADTD
jgi:hypothetical protein